MSEQSSTSDLEIREGDNIFDKYFTLIESKRLRVSKRNNFHLIECVITIIERNLQDLAQEKDIDKGYLESVDDVLKKVLISWYNIFGFIMTRNSLEELKLLSYNLLGFSFLISKHSYSKDDLLLILSFFSPSHDLDHLNYPDELPPAEINVDMQIPIFKYLHRYKNNIFFYNIENITKGDIEQIRQNLTNKDLVKIINNYINNKTHDVSYRWSIVVKTLDASPTANKWFFLLYTLSEALKAIDPENIEITLNSWGDGSKWAKLSLKIRTLLAREETKDILIKSRKALESELFDKRIEEVEKLRTEAEKNRKELQNFKTAQQAQESNELDLESKKLEVIKKSLEIEDQIVEIKLKRLQAIEKITSLVQAGFIQNDSVVQLEINNLLFFRSDKEYQGGYSMERISQKESFDKNQED